MKKINLWMTGGSLHFIKTIKLLVIPRVGERVVDEECRHYKVEKVFHLAAPNKSMLNFSDKKLQPRTELWVVEY